MQDRLSRAQRYRNLAEGMADLARSEPDPARRAELQDLADQYRKLAEKALGSQPRT